TGPGAVSGRKKRACALGLGGRGTRPERGKGGCEAPGTHPQAVSTVDAPPFTNAVRRVLRRTAAGSSVVAARTAATRDHGFGRMRPYAKALGQSAGDLQEFLMSARVLVLTFDAGKRLQEVLLVLLRQPVIGHRKEALVLLGNVLAQQNHVTPGLV